MVFAHYNKETNSLHVNLHKTDIIRAIRGDTVTCETSKGRIAFRHADKTLDGGITSDYVWEHTGSEEYDRKMTLTSDTIVRLLAHGKTEKYTKTDSFPHRVCVSAAVERQA